MEPELIHVAGEAANQGGCVLCNSPDFLRGGFGDRTMIICDQCEREFHIGCLAEHGRAKLTELPDGVHSFLARARLRAAMHVAGKLIRILCGAAGVMEGNLLAVKMSCEGYEQWAAECAA